MSFVDDLRDLDFQNLHAWPPAAKVGAVALVCVLIIGLGAWFFVKPVYEDVQRAQRQEVELRSTFEAKQKKAANLDKYKQQLEEMKEIYGAMLRQLPSKTEMPDLLVDISQAALGAGIENDLFQPGNETVKEFYAELPIRLRMVGGYHNFGKFISDVASLPRIVILTMHDISLRPAQQPGQLILEGTAKTYRYVEEGETVFDKNNKGGGK